MNVFFRYVIPKFFSTSFAVFYSFDSFGVQHVPRKIKHFIGNKKMQANIFRIQANNSIMSGYLYTEFF